MNSKHETLVERVAERLAKKGFIVFLHSPYDHGEMDISRQIGDKIVYYEIKTNYSNKSYMHAVHQFNKFLKENPDGRCVYVSEENGKLRARRYKRP